MAHSISFAGLQEIYWRGRHASELPAFDRVAASVLWFFRDVPLPAMDVFFVLSSFLITGILLRTRGKAGYFASFYFRRTLRIWPLYYVVLGALVFVATKLPAGPSPSIQRTQAYFWTYTSNVLLAQGWDHAPEAFHHLWSLAIEEQFYLIWPVVVFLVPLSRLRAVCLFALLFALAYRAAMYAHGAGAAVYVSTLGRVDQLALGAVLALENHQRGTLDHWARASARGVIACLIAVVWLVALRGSFAEPDIVLGTVGHTVYAVLGLCLVGAGTASEGTIMRFFSNPWFQLCGRRSYAIYLCHQPITLLLCTACGLNVWRLSPLTGSVVFVQIIAAVATFALSSAIAAVAWVCIESPALQLRRYLPYER